MYYLIKEITTFYDPHGTGDEGGKSLSVNRDHAEYGNCKEGVELIYNEYDEDAPEGWTEPTSNMEENWFGEDGYNCQIETIIVKKISEEEYKAYENIIHEYEKLL